MTIESIEKDARRILQDATPPYRWSSEDIRSILQKGIHSLHAIRPETKYVNGRFVDCILLPEGNNEDISINDRYEEALVYYVVHKCYLTDATDTINLQLAETYLSKFNTKAQL